MSVMISSAKTVKWQYRGGKRAHGHPACGGSANRPKSLPGGEVGWDSG
jgi:hypothetical protein